MSIYCQDVIINIIKDLNGNFNFKSNREPQKVFEYGIH